MIKIETQDDNIELQKPIFINGQVTVDAESSSIPGFYSISPSRNVEFVVDLSDTEIYLMTYIQRQIRKNLRTKYNVPLSGLYFEEHKDKKIASYLIPFHIDRLKEYFSVDIYQPHIEDYLKSNYPRQQSEGINAGITDLLQSPDVNQEIEKILRGTAINNEDSMPPVKTVIKERQADEILEVYDEEELPIPPKGKKYFVCIGGNKNFQCFLSDENITRGEFIYSHENELDASLRPVYSDDEIIVRQDVKYAIPGFYIISPRNQYQSIDDMPQSTFTKSVLLAREIKKVLSKLGINQSHIYNDEKYTNPAFAHFWVLPIYQEFVSGHNLNPTIFSRDIWTYLDLFPRFSTTKDQIHEFNYQMTEHLGKLDKTTLASG